MKTIVQHTSGPWELCPTVHSNRLTIFGTAKNRERHIGTFISGSKTELGEFRANVALIAAAPDLLEALKELVERDRAEAAESGFTDEEMSWLEDARRVIAKATAL